MRKLLHGLRVLVSRLPLGETLVQTYFSLTSCGAHRRSCRRLRRYGFEIYRNVHEIMLRANIAYWADFGTLLGLVRDNGPIAHDDDVDYSLPPGSDLRKVFLSFRGTDFRLDHAFAMNGEIVELAYSYKGVNVDFFKCHVIENKIGNYVFVTEYDKRTGKLLGVMAHERARAMVSRLVTRGFGTGESVRVSVPENAEELLSSSYGNWRIPDSSVNGCSNRLPSQHREVYQGCSLLFPADVKMAFDQKGT